MNKAAIPIGVLATTTTAAVPTAIVLSGNSSSGNGNEQEIITPPSQQQKFGWSKYIPTLTSAEDIKSNYTNTECLKDSFKEINWNKGSASNEKPVYKPLLGSDSTKGCLIVEHYKWTYSDTNKWSGGFKLAWSLTNESQGLLVVANAKTENREITGDVVIYLMNKGSDGKWAVSHASTKKEHKISSSKEELEKLIPQAGEAIEDEYKNNYWKFNPDLSTICGEGECKEGNKTETKESAIWVFEESANFTTGQVGRWNNKISGWINSNAPTWGTYFESNIQGVFGKWTKRQ